MARCVCRKVSSSGIGFKSLLPALRTASLVGGALGLTWHVGSQEVDGKEGKTQAEIMMAKLAKVASVLLG